MQRLANNIAEIKNHYTVVVVGSGYGASIAASRMARAQQKVCVLERGKEWLPGEYPRTPLQAAKEMQVDFPEEHVGDRRAIYDFRVNRDISVFLGCGLGGTSLVNANVSLRADPRVFQDQRWPLAIRSEATQMAGGDGSRCSAVQRLSLCRGDAEANPLSRYISGAAQACGARTISQRTGGQDLSSPYQCDLRGKNQPCGSGATPLQIVRRLRDRVQSWGQKHLADELSARRQKPRCRNLHPSWGPALGA